MSWSSSSSSFKSMSSAASRAHNKRVLESLRKGDRVQFKRSLYSHWGVYIGSGKIIHLTRRNAERGGPKGVVREDDFWDAVGGDCAYKNNSRDNKSRPLPPDEIVKRAKSMLGDAGYNLLKDNCEHFANWCRYGETESQQVYKGMFAGGYIYGTAGSAAIVASEVAGGGMAATTASGALAVGAAAGVCVAGVGIACGLLLYGTVKLATKLKKPKRK
ncbi:phospholipase A and acyltransferase 2 [Aplysia californica]|uniref:Phospholipase A and acyltransferase 2 n=1 Tax=Aplysia californica TaxID=6500 RepID=A0ABM0ZUH8_APLCA|nr:phospholipase A and acyltransferase 2 [Aplysia californica]